MTLQGMHRSLGGAASPCLLQLLTLMSETMGRMPQRQCREDERRSDRGSCLARHMRA